MKLALFEPISSVGGLVMREGNETNRLLSPRRFWTRGPEQRLQTLGLDEGLYLGGSVTGLATHSAGTSVSVCPMGDEGRAVWAFKPFTGWDGAMHTLVFIQVLHVAAAKMGKIPVGA